MSTINVRRTAHILRANSRRVIAKPYLPGEEITPGGDTRSSLLMQRILAIPEEEVPALIESVLASFSARHPHFEAMLEKHFDLVAHHVGQEATYLSRERRLLIGAFYTHEYSVEGAALFNPSIVLSPDQTGLADGVRRVILSLRAVGEGHISSIEFRTATLDSNSALVFDALGNFVVSGNRTPPATYNKATFTTKLSELNAENALSRSVLKRLPDHFTSEELEFSLAALAHGGPPDAISFESAKIIRLLAASNYVTTFPESTTLSERVIFPAAPVETRGMEDARFVRFVREDGGITYYATYTAYDGFQILPQLIETNDFRSFSISTLNGAAAQNKGMALFPRKIGGKFVMLSRKDRENLHLTVSEDVRFWKDVVHLDQPHAPWELVQIGNCGSPLETAEGWLVITHGVGPMRRYVLGAILLDLDDPSRVIGRLTEPLLEPNESERDGYVPNVVYSCGAIINGSDLILPYGLSDGAVGVCVLAVSEILASMKRVAA